MCNLLVIKYLIKAFFYTLIKNYNKAIRYYIKNLTCNLTPKARLVDYNKNIEKIADSIIKKKNIAKNINIGEYSSKRILILCTEIYDTGGHTQCALNYTSLFHKEYDIFFYLTNIFYNQGNHAPVKSEKIQQYVKDFHISNINKTYEDKIIELYNYIIENHISTINVNMHMQDVVGCAVLYLINKYTNINIIFWNHADHIYSLGTVYADKILTRCKNNKAITSYLANYQNVCFLPFLINNELSDNLCDIRQNLSIPEGAFITLTGCASHKLGDSYFELIQRILTSNSNIYHILVSNLSQEEKTKYYEKYKFDTKHFIVRDFTPYFDNYINSADAYIDSFPQGSALTLVDCIKLSTPVVIKVDSVNPEKSFEEYLYKNYELACKTPEEMFDAVMKLENNTSFYNEIKEKVYKYFNDTYSNEKVKPLYEELIK